MHVFLEKLEIFGFKSFAEKIEVRLSPGITGVIGPNGCGKTNISDALRWVLGEQNMRHLRGDVAEDVIFGGSSTRKPLGMAEAILTISNSKNILPTEYTELQVGRRIYRGQGPRTQWPIFTRALGASIWLRCCTRRCTSATPPALAAACRPGNR